MGLRVSELIKQSCELVKNRSTHNPPSAAISIDDNGTEVEMSSATAEN